MDCCWHWSTLGLAFGPPDLRRPALIGFFGLVVIIAQVIFMWANRNMVMPYTRAQRLYLAEDFEAACHLLEELRARRWQGRCACADACSAMPIGSAICYRKAKPFYARRWRLQPNHYFSRYGFGRTLLVQGRYAEAVEVSQQTLDVLRLMCPRLFVLMSARLFIDMGNWTRHRRCSTKRCRVVWNHIEKSWDGICFIAWEQGLRPDGR